MRHRSYEANACVARGDYLSIHSHNAPALSVPNAALWLSDRPVAAMKKSDFISAWKT